MQTTANLNFSLFGLSSGLNLLYSTDQSHFRQNMNNLSFNASWKWLTVQAGDVSPNFSEYGINGATIRGGYIKITPGSWQLELSGGRSKRSVENSLNQGFRRSAFERWSMAGKVGFGSDENEHFFLSAHYSVDKHNSLKNPIGLTPQENLTVTPDFKIAFFKEALTMDGQVTISAFTRDLNSPKLPMSGIGIPSFLTNIMQAHTSSRINYAGKASASLDLNEFGMEVGYERVQPGFRSLGVGRIRNDQQQISIAPSVQLFNNKLMLQSNIVLGRDNLLGTRLLTQRNTTVGTNAQLKITDRISINGNYNLLVNNISSSLEPDTSLQQGFALDQKQLSHTFTLQPTIIFQSAGRTHSISLAGSYFSLMNEFKGLGPSTPAGMESNTYSTSVAYSLTFPTGFSIHSMGNFLVNRSNHSQNISLGTNIGASYSLFERKLTLSFNGGFNQNTNEVIRTGLSRDNIKLKARQLMFNLVSSYRLSDKDSFSLTIRNRTNTIIQGGGSTFSELELSFNYQHRF